MPLLISKGLRDVTALRWSDGVNHISPSRKAKLVFEVQDDPFAKALPKISDNTAADDEACHNCTSEHVKSTWLSSLPPSEASGQKQSRADHHQPVFYDTATASKSAFSVGHRDSFAFRAVMPKNDEVPGSSFADSSSFQTATAAQQCPKVSARRSPPPPVCTLPRIYAVGPSSLKNSPSPTAKDKHPPPALFNNKRESLRSCLKSHQPEFATNRGASRSCSGGGLVPAASRRSSVSDARSSDLLDHDAEVTASVVTPIECKASYRSRSSTHPHRNPLHTAFEASEAPQGAQLAEARTANSVSSHDCRAISDSALIHIPPRTTATDDDDSQENRISGSIRHNKSFSGPSRGSMMSGNGGALVRRARRSSQTSGILLPTNNLDGRPSTASSVAVSIETRKSCNSKALPADSGNLRYDILSISPDDDVCQPANLRASRSKSFSGAPYQRMINNRSERASYPVTIVATHDMESLSSAPTSVRDTIRSCNSRRATLEGNGLVNRQALSTPGNGKRTMKRRSSSHMVSFARDTPPSAGYDPRELSKPFEEALETVFNLSHSDSDKFEQAVRLMEMKEEGLRQRLLADRGTLAPAVDKWTSMFTSTKSSIASIVAKAIQGNQYRKSLVGCELPEAQGMGTDDVRLKWQNAAASALDERRLEAVYLSFAMFGQWNADKLKALPTGAECKGLHLRGFFNLCREVEILSVASTGDVGKLAPQDATNIFMDLADPGSLLISFPKFLIALVRVCDVMDYKVDGIMSKILNVNKDTTLCLHVIIPSADK